MKQIYSLTVIVFIVLLIGSCKSPINYKNIVGTWKIADVNIDVPNASDLLVSNAEILSYSTQYTFNSDSSVIVTIAENELDKAIKYEGVFIIENEKSIRLKILKVAIKNDEEWQYLDKNDFSQSFFEDFVYTIESFSSNEVIIEEAEKDGTIKYTLTKE